MASNGKNVLVTGGAGFIGSRLVEKLVLSGNKVTILDNLSSGFSKNIDNFADVSSVKLIQDDIRNEKIVDSLAQKADLIFHLAEYIPNTETHGAGHVVKYSIDNPLAEFDVSCKGTLTVLQSARKYSKKLIFTSTAAVYGESQYPNIEENHLTKPISPYGASKLCAETYVNLYYRIYKMPTVILRLFNVYGPKQRKYVMYDLLRKLKNSPNELVVLGNGSEERDFIYVDDVVAALLLVAENDAAIGQTFNVGSGKATSTKSLVAAILDQLGVNPRIIFTNASWDGNVNRLCSDISKLSALGFKPEYSLSSGLRSFVEWFNKNE